ncbi:MAG: ATP-binding cassette domain-containing protein, partial [Pseudomonadales bacterium]|nr:ATP-binding cassette domain-containing protein [Pseudomonadales bacterium]
SIYGILCPNGAGKATTLRMIMSILVPDAGRIQLLGNDHPESVKDRLGYLPEEKGLYRKMRSGELLTYFGRLKGMSRHDARHRAEELLDRFGLAHCRDMRCDALSKGMSQKVQIMSTLLHNPDLIILDEPFSGLDPINTEVVRQMILDLKAKGSTVIFSTHVMEQAEQICDHILLVHRGRKILDGTVAEVKGAGEQTIRIVYDGDARCLDKIRGVRRINDMGRHAELSLSPEADPQAILRCLMDHLVIHQFTVKEPSLHEVFVRSVGEVPE